MDPKPIGQHEGKKYLRVIYPAGGVEVRPKSELIGLEVDVYAVLEAFGVTCPARQHAVKKLLCAGLRGKGGELADLVGALAAVSRAVELQKVRDAVAGSGGPPAPADIPPGSDHYPPEGVQ
jgi:hypothetical protein